jgi:hypothetical protein
MVRRAERAEATGDGSEAIQTATPTTTTNPSGQVTSTTESPPDEPEAVTQVRPTASILLASGDEVVLRGRQLRVEGGVAEASRSCAQVRVDISLEGEGQKKIPLGALTTDAEGHFAGTLVVPYEVAVGTYWVSASSPGRPGICGPGRSESEP